MDLENKTIDEILEEFNPVEKLINLFYETDDEKNKIDICAALLKYMYALPQEE